ncbi:MAG: ANTAR domain-containing protein [Clostridia bacterium]|nr:ANTAR domain-containing protein [Clostridia bacterium]
MKNALVITSTDKNNDFFNEMLKKINLDTVDFCNSGGVARRLLLQRTFDLCIINAPLTDENGIKLAIDIITNQSNQVILIVNSAYIGDVTQKVEDYGILTVEKPIYGQMFWTTLKLADITSKRLNNIQNENAKLKKKIEEIKLIDRAKCFLIEYKNISEDEAHKEIEERAMNSRKTKVEVAKQIINLYSDDFD